MRWGHEPTSRNIRAPAHDTLTSPLTHHHRTLHLLFVPCYLLHHLQPRFLSPHLMSFPTMSVLENWCRLRVPRIKLGIQRGASIYGGMGVLGLPTSGWGPLRTQDTRSRAGMLGFSQLRSPRLVPELQPCISSMASCQ